MKESEARGNGKQGNERHPDEGGERERWEVGSGGRKCEGGEGVRDGQDKKTTYRIKLN